jgi:hypothetical protein
MDDKCRKAMFARMNNPRSMRFSNDEDDKGTKVFEQSWKVEMPQDRGDFPEEKKEESRLEDKKEESKSEEKKEESSYVPSADLGGGSGNGGGEPLGGGGPPSDDITIIQPKPVVVVVGSPTITKDAKGRDILGPPKEEVTVPPFITSYQVDTGFNEEDLFGDAKIKKPASYSDDKRVIIDVQQPKQTYDKYGERVFETTPSDSYTRLDFVPESVPIERVSTKGRLDERISRFNDVRKEIINIRDSSFYNEKEKADKIKLLADEAELLDKDIKLLGGLYKSESMQTFGGAMRYGAERGVEDAREKVREMVTGGVSSLPGEATSFVKEVAYAPARVVRGGISLGKHAALRGVDLLEQGAISRGIEAGAATAGAAISGVIGETRDIISLPKQEFWMPPGYQKVWNGEKYVISPIPRHPMEPWAVTRGMGIGMPQGIVPSSPQQVTLMAGETASPWGGVVPKEYTEVPRDLWEVPKFVPPKMEMPKSVGWLIPPPEVIYGAQQKPRGRVQMQARPDVQQQKSGRMQVQTRPDIQQQRSGRMQVHTIPAISQRGVSAPIQRPISRSLQLVQPQRVIPSKVVYPSIRKIPTLPKIPIITAKSKSVGARIPSSVGRVISEKHKLDELRATPGYNEPAIRKTEASFQSKMDYALRHNEPGTFGRYVLEAEVS